MIARTWRGSVRARDAERYVDYLRQTGLADYGSTPGNLAVLGLRRVSGERAEFLLVSLWDSQQAIRRFAGEDLERAVFYPDDEQFLIEREEHADHFEVVHLGTPDGSNDGGDAGVHRVLRRLAEWWLSRGVTTSRWDMKTVGRLTPHGFTYVRLP